MRDNERVKLILVGYDALEEPLRRDLESQ